MPFDFSFEKLAAAVTTLLGTAIAAKKLKMTHSVTMSASDAVPDSDNNYNVYLFFKTEISTGIKNIRIQDSLILTPEEPKDCLTKTFAIQPHKDRYKIKLAFFPLHGGHDVLKVTAEITNNDWFSFLFQLNKLSATIQLKKTPPGSKRRRYGHGADPMDYLFNR